VTANPNISLIRTFSGTAELSPSAQLGEEHEREIHTLYNVPRETALSFRIRQRLWSP